MGDLLLLDNIVLETIWAGRLEIGQHVNPRKEWGLGKKFTQGENGKWAMGSGPTKRDKKPSPELTCQPTYQKNTRKSY